MPCRLKSLLRRVEQKNKRTATSAKPAINAFMYHCMYACSWLIMAHHGRSYTIIILNVSLGTCIWFLGVFRKIPQNTAVRNFWYPTNLHWVLTSVSPVILRFSRIPKCESEVITTKHEPFMQVNLPVHASTHPKIDACLDPGGRRFKS